MRWSVFLHEGSLPGRRGSWDSLPLTQVSEFMSFSRGHLQNGITFWGVWGRFWHGVGYRWSVQTVVYTASHAIQRASSSHIMQHYGRKVGFSLQSFRFSLPNYPRGYKIDRGGVWGDILTKLYFLRISIIFCFTQRGQPYCSVGLVPWLFLCSILRWLFLDCSE